ncbi:hypothetical protein SAY87_002273 [Trapa incisa]|uniref:Uncharacterized protein n=1 Tax=Trapa incisa TaxID=236973 RepID=A0AAN7JWI4_9MYRT|nr:hypothetical protein SAY87_002273 [Trapa incisa]
MAPASAHLCSSMACYGLQGHTCLPRANLCLPNIYKSIHFLGILKKPCIRRKGVEIDGFALISGDGDVISYHNTNRAAGHEAFVDEPLQEELPTVQINPDPISFGILDTEISSKTSSTLCTIIARHFHKRNTNRNPTGRDPTDGPPILFDTQGGTLQLQVQASPEEEEPRAADLHARDIGESSRSIGPSPSPIGEVGESENGIEEEEEEEEEGGKVLALTDHGGNGEIQPVRRSFSIDSPASEIYRAVAISMQDQSPDRLKKQAMKIKSFSVISTQHIFRGYGSRRSASLFKMVKSCSFRTALGKDPINMKRLAPKSSSSSSSDDNHGKRSVARAVKS